MKAVVAGMCRRSRAAAIGHVDSDTLPHACCTTVRHGSDSASTASGASTNCERHMSMGNEQA